MANNDLLALTAEIVSAHVANNTVATNDISELIRTTFESLSKIENPVEPEAPKQEPAVSIRSSVKPDYVACLEDGKKMKMLKRHLQTDHGMTVAEYKAKWGLPADYPMVAPNYAATRKELAHKIGLGRKAAPAPEPAPQPAPMKRSRKAAPNVDEVTITPASGQRARKAAAPKAKKAPASKKKGIVQKLVEKVEDFFDPGATHTE